MHRGQGRIDVAIAPADIGAQEGFGVVLDLLRHGVVGLAELEDHVGRAGVGAGRHGGNVRGLQQEEAGRAGARARRSDIDDDGNARAEDGAGHGAHGVDQAARRIELHQQGRGAVGVGARNGAVELAGADRLDGVGEDELFDQGLRPGCWAAATAGSQCATRPHAIQNDFGRENPIREPARGLKHGLLLQDPRPALLRLPFLGGDLAQTVPGRPGCWGSA